MSVVLPSSLMPTPDKPPEEAGWTMELLTDRAYLAIEGEQYWHQEQWKVATPDVIYAVPMYVRRPGKSFDPDKWCDRCELPEEDCCCAGAKGMVSPEPAYSPGDGARAMVQTISRIVMPTRVVEKVAVGEFPEDDKPLPWYKRIKRLFS